jgi:excisionase family DNA binding protein
MALQQHGLPVKLLLTVQEAAQALGIGRSVVYELLLAGDLSGVRIGRTRRIPVSELERFIAARLEGENRHE